MEWDELVKLLKELFDDEEIIDLCEQLYKCGCTINITKRKEETNDLYSISE